jgi:hypothetical protein
MIVAFAVWLGLRRKAMHAPATKAIRVTKGDSSLPSKKHGNDIEDWSVWLFCWSYPNS